MPIDFSSVPVFSGRYSHLKYAANEVNFQGHHLEFGVHAGATLNFLAASFSETKWWGFDSFEGLPERWNRSADGKRHSEKGDFAIAKPPRIEPNAELVIGFFEDVLNTWMQQNPGHISFIHIDSDLYSSAKTILWTLNDRIVEGTIIVFDELRDWSEQGVYELWRSGEWKALDEWIVERGREIEPLARTDWIEGSIRVKR